MRFLLNAASVAASTRTRGASAVVATTNNKGANATSTAAASAASLQQQEQQQQQPQRLQKTWGQQCSPNCGCIVRYETVVDETTDRIVDVSYHAKSILSTSSSSKDDGGLVPQLTQRSGTSRPNRSANGTSTSRPTTTGRPILTECRCTTLHHLSSRITTYLKDRPFQHIYNTAEFSSVRSSPSFRRAVLAANGLGRGSTSCYDLVEEAFVACIKGYMPRPRCGHDAASSIVYLSCDNDDDTCNDNDEAHAAKTVLAQSKDAQGYSAAKEPSRGIDLNPSRYADAARRAGRAYYKVPPQPQLNGQTNVYKAGDPKDNMPSYSLLENDSRREMEETEESVSQYRPRSTVGAASQVTSASSGDGMPAFHVSEEHNLSNEFEKRYDDELGGLREEVQRFFTTTDGSNIGNGSDEVTDDDEGALLPDDWLEYVDGFANDRAVNQSR